MEQKLHDTGFGNDFGYDTKHKWQKGKLDKTDFIKLEEVCASRHKQHKRQPMEWKIFVNQVWIRGLYSEIYSG